MRAVAELGSASDGFLCQVQGFVPVVLNDGNDRLQCEGVTEASDLQRPSRSAGLLRATDGEHRAPVGPECGHLLLRQRVFRAESYMTGG